MTQGYRDGVRLAIAEWAERSKLHVVNVIRDDYLAGRSLRRRTGTAQRSVNGEVNNKRNGFKVGSTSIVLISWEYGIRAHDIFPKGKRARGALRFVVNGRTVFARKVHKKAQKARPSFGPAMQGSKIYMYDLASKLLTEVLNKYFPNKQIKLL